MKLPVNVPEKYQTPLGFLHFKGYQELKQNGTYEQEAEFLKLWIEKYGRDERATFKFIEKELIANPNDMEEPLYLLFKQSKQKYDELLRTGRTILASKIITYTDGIIKL
jgi:hypothetical protein